MPRLITRLFEFVGLLIWLIVILMAYVGSGANL